MNYRTRQPGTRSSTGPMRSCQRFEWGDAAGAQSPLSQGVQPPEGVNDGSGVSTGQSGRKAAHFKRFAPANDQRDSGPHEAYPPRASKCAFTLVELLVVITIIAVLASLLLPAFSKAKAKAQGIPCSNNLRQMTVAWHIYASENNDRVPMNLGRQAGTDWESWVRGCLSLDVPPPWLRVAPSDSTDDSYLRRSPLTLCGATPGIWRCPADKSTRTVNGVRLPRIRSLSMNEQLGNYSPNGKLPVPTWVTDWMTRLMVKKTADIRNPGPVGCFVFQDEREDSIKDSRFLVRPDGFRQGDPALYWLVSLPGSYHNGGGNLSFADGHVESHRWVDPRTKPPLVRDHDQPGTVNGAPCPGNPDVQWLQERTFQRGD